jgi:hypothetical protein
LKLSVSYEASCQQCNNMQFMSSPPVFRGVRVTRFLVLCVWFVDRYSSIYGFWIPLWYLQTLLMYMLIRYFGSKCFLSRFLRCSLVASIITRDFRSAKMLWLQSWIITDDQTYIPISALVLACDYLPVVRYLWKHGGYQMVYMMLLF